jgi:hypothetical protein
MTATPRSDRPRGRRGPGDRGAVLVIALLLMLALTGIGLAAMTSAANDLDLTGSARVSAVARAIASAGAEGTMAFAGMNPSGFTQFLSAQGGVVQMGDLSAGFFDTSATGNGSFGREAMAGQWTTRAESVLTTHRAPGFQLGEYCFRRYITSTDGTYRQEGVTEAMGRDRNALARAMTALFVGPVDCP